MYTMRGNLQCGATKETGKHGWMGGGGSLAEDALAVGAGRRGSVGRGELGVARNPKTL